GGAVASESVTRPDRESIAAVSGVPVATLEGAALGGAAPGIVCRTESGQTPDWVVATESASGRAPTSRESPEPARAVAEGSADTPAPVACPAASASAPARSESSGERNLGGGTGSGLQVI